MLSEGDLRPDPPGYASRWSSTASPGRNGRTLAHGGRINSRVALHSCAGSVKQRGETRACPWRPGRGHVRGRQFRSRTTLSEIVVVRQETQERSSIPSARSREEVPSEGFAGFFPRPLPRQPQRIKMAVIGRVGWFRRQDNTVKVGESRGSPIKIGISEPVVRDNC